MRPHRIVMKADWIEARRAFLADEIAGLRQAGGQSCARVALPLFQPFLRVRKTVRKQRNTAQPEDSRISLGILVGYSHVDSTSFGKLPNLELPIGRIDFGRLGDRFS